MIIFQTKLNIMFQETTPVGVAKNLTLEDLAEIMPDVASSLQNVLEYEGDVENDMFMTFQISVGEYGKIKTVDLKVVSLNNNLCYYKLMI